MVIPILNAVQVSVLNDQYQSLAKWLNNRENHRTSTRFEDGLILKLFAFQFVNSYAALFYIAFIKEHMGDPCLYNCMTELAQTLVTIVLTQIIVENLIGTFQPRITAYFKKRQMLQGLQQNKNKKTQQTAKLSTIEEEFLMEEYPMLMGTLDDYSQLSIRFGFATLFVCSCPVMPLLEYTR